MFVARGQSPEVFDFQEETLDEIALAIEGIVAENLWRCLSGRDDGHSALLANGLPERLRVVAFVAKDIFGRQTRDQGFGVGVVAGLSWGENKSQRIAQGIDDSVDLGGQPAA